MAHFINKYLTQAAYDADSTKQYPNASLVNGSMVYQPTQPVVDVPDVVAEITVSSNGDYNLTNINRPVSPGIFEYVKVDGVAIDFGEYEENGYTWPLTAGNHTITYKHTTGEEDMSDANITIFQGQNYTINSLTVNDYYDHYAYGSGDWDNGITATNIDLWDGFDTITREEFEIDESTEMLAPFTCTNITLRSNTLVSLGHVQCDCSCMGVEEDGEGCYRCNEYDENDECIDKEYVELIDFYDIPSVSGNIYVPSALVSRYSGSEWNDSGATITAIA
jgi:hypothetical protein